MFGRHHSVFAAQVKSPGDVEREQGELLLAKYGLRPKAKLIQKVRTDSGWCDAHAVTLALLRSLLSSSLKSKSIGATGGWSTLCVPDLR